MISALRPAHLGRALAAALVATSAGLGQETTRLSATFDWFAYEGRDPVYETLEAGPNEYLNPIMTGFYPDPSIVKKG